MDRDLEKRFFEAFPSLISFPQRSLKPLLAQAVRKSLEPMQILAHAGNKCTSLPFVLEGRLRVFKTSETGRELTLYRIDRGESCILTATCILNGGTFPAIAAAEANSTIVLMPAGLLLRMVEEHTEWRRFIFSLYSRRLEAVLRLLEEVARILNDLEAEGLIVTLRGRIEIRRPGELRKKAKDSPAL